MIDLDYVVAGTGRSGTKYTAAAFTLAGTPTGHEDVLDFVDDGQQNARAARAGVRGESSLAAAIYLARLAPEARVVHVVRDPVATVRSFLASSFFAWDARRCPCHPDTRYAHRRTPYAQFLGRHYPELGRVTSELGRVATYIALVTHRIARAAALGRRPYLRVRLEDLADDGALIADVAAWASGRRLGPIAPPAAKNVATHALPTVGWAEILAAAPAAGTDLAELALLDDYSTP